MVESISAGRATNLSSEHWAGKDQSSTFFAQLLLTSFVMLCYATMLVYPAIQLTYYPLQIHLSRPSNQSQYGTLGRKRSKLNLLSREKGEGEVGLFPR